MLCVHLSSGGSASRVCAELSEHLFSCAIFDVFRVFSKIQLYDILPPRFSKPKGSFFQQWGGGQKKKSVWVISTFSKKHPETEKKISGTLFEPRTAPLPTYHPHGVQLLARGRTAVSSLRDR